MQTFLTPKDLNFVGYTYKNFEAVKGLLHSIGKRFCSNVIMPKYHFLNSSSSSFPYFILKKNFVWLFIIMLKNLALLTKYF